jgi:hypothetical protein
MRFGRNKSEKPVTFQFSKLADVRKLPKLPKHFGHETFVAPHDWGVLGNDRAGDCVLAGAAHETMTWGAMGQTHMPPRFDEAAVIKSYSAWTGYDPRQTDLAGNNPTDNGTNMQAAADRRRKEGLVDANGVPHKIVAYVAVDPNDVQMLYQAVYLFAACGWGFNCPSDVISQFEKGKPWSVHKGQTMDGDGHYVQLVAKRTHLQCVTWGWLQGMTLGYVEKYGDEALAYVSEEALTERKSPEGFDYDTLLADLRALKK